MCDRYLKKEKRKKKVKRAGRHFGFFKRAGHHGKGAGRRALQKKCRQNTVNDINLAKLAIIFNVEQCFFKTKILKHVIHMWVVVYTPFDYFF